MNKSLEEKPPAPPLRLTSQKNLHHHSLNHTLNHSIKNLIPVDFRPLPKEPVEDNDNGKGLKKAKSKVGKSGKKEKSVSDNFNIDKPVISPPTNFEHTLHVGFDSVTNEFTGMPESWTRLLKTANISKIEQKKNPQAVIDVLDWFESSTHEKMASTPKFMTIHPSASKLIVNLN